MVGSDVEKKIIEFIKNSPIGVTSSDIASYLGLNRMTISKYLAIIKEKALVDFKQLGMAKLWYVPVTLTREGYYNEVLLNLGAECGDEMTQKKVKKAAITTAKSIEEQYKLFHGTDKLTYKQALDSLVDAQRKIGGNFVVMESADDLIVLRNTKCPFGERVKKSPCLCATTSALCGVMTAKHLGYSKVVLKKTIARGAENCIVYIHLKRTSDKEKADEYS